ncbi:MAG: hypothetical protein QOE07_2255 [Acidimicrobiaceae bacterium]|jgi:hypothetical protein|nr:hypothetical protein [Acidimicrobiaceae bacterium]MDQ1413667.1 hypothetical protein [Acidimicrobiaceae bacterium]MDQ1442981.1 hypothetical protein [Acidimicrobiaceae bacterium]
MGIANDKLRRAANEETKRRFSATSPVLVEVRPAAEVVPGFRDNTILTSGPPMAWDQYIGGQREAVIGAAQYEGLGRGRDEVIERLDSGDIVVLPCSALHCVGSVAGVYSASMPVFVVEDANSGGRAFCNLYEGSSPRRLNYGCYDDEVHDRLMWIRHHLGPAMQDLISSIGPVELRPIMRRALHMGDELHSRNNAGCLLFMAEVVRRAGHLGGGMDLATVLGEVVADQYFFLRLSMGAAKCIADRGHGVEASSVVTAMAISCRGFGIRVSGLGDQWFTGPPPVFEGQFFEGHTEAEVSWMGGESIMAETVGLGGFSQAAAPALHRYQGGTVSAMVERNLEMYEITVGEDEDFKIPYFDYRGSPVGIDIFRVAETGILPVMDAGLAGAGGGQIGAGVVRAPLECFQAAVEAYDEKYRSEA